MSVSLLLVGRTDETSPERLRALDDAVDASAATLQEALDRLADGAAVDCVVVASEVGDRSAALEQLAAAAPSVPRVVVDDGGLDACGAVAAGASDVVPVDDPEVFVRRVRSLVGGGPESEARLAADGGDRGDGESRAPDERETTARLRRLHAVARELDDAETEAEIYESVVAAAADILAFDHCVVGVVEDGEIRPRAGNHAPLLSDPVLMDVDEGVLGRTVRTRETTVVDDAAADPDASPVDDDYRSALTVPVGDWGVFQAVSTERAAFSEADRTLAELLVSHLESAVERVRTEATLRAERDRFAALVENIPDAVICNHFEDGEPIIDHVNPAFERIFGYDADAVEGESIDDLVVPPENRDEAESINRTVQTGEDLEAEVVRMTTEGPRAFLLRNAPFSQDETHRGWAIYTDIEDLKHRERELERQNERLDEFASVVSHDLRSPLSAAQSNVEAAMEGLPGDNLGNTMGALDRMNRLIEDLLALARKGQVVSDPEPTDVGMVARAAWRTVDAPDATLAVGTLPTVAADPDRLRELFENCFRNAVQHGPADVTVTVDGLPAGDGFSVADDGPGISVSDPGEVFDPGFTTHDDGNGLGLAIVEEIAAAHGWTVHATESADSGARFEFVFDPASHER